MNRRLVVAVLVLAALAAPAAARPRSVVIDDPNAEIGELGPQGLVPYNTLFLNRCAGGCPIRVGTSNSINNTWPIGSNRTLTAWPYDEATWQAVFKCVKDVFEPYNVNVTDVDPGTAKHFEIMIAGSPTDLGMSSSIGGVAPGGPSTSCSGYLDNALVFDFAKVWGSGTTCGASCIEDICSTAAQEIGHTWYRLDHVIDNKDPMTYFSYSGRKYFQNTSAQCGSDCVDGLSPNNQTCTGSATNPQNHNCICGGATQNTHQAIVSLFGAGPGSPPLVTITDPKLGASVTPGFAIRSEVTDNSAVTKVEAYVDGALVGMLIAGPFVFNAPTALADGSHKVEVKAYDPHGFVGSKMVDVMIGPPCTKPSDCSKDTDTCVGGRCVPGAGVQGGLGSTCTVGTECASGQCGTDGSSSYCVEQCVVGDCPDDFGCDVPDGQTMGVCWPGFDDGTGGGCGCQSSDSGTFGMLLMIGLVALTCRKRRARS